MPAVVLVTGVSRYLGARVAAELAADETIERVIGVDTAPPVGEPARRLGRTEFVRADIRNPLIARVVANARVDTVLHLALTASTAATGGSRSVLKEMNVIGTMQLLAASQKSAHVRRLVVQSTTAVYGGSAGEPAAFTEQTEPAAPPRSGLAKDAVEVEGYVRGLSRRRPDLAVAVLRLAAVVGPSVDTSLTRYLSHPVVPTVFGYDPRLQLLHEQDAVAALLRAGRGEFRGVVNVAGAGVLTLSQAIRRAGRIVAPVPGPAAGTVARLLRRAGRSELSPGGSRLLDVGRVVDTTRMRREFGFQPRYDTAGALAAFAATLRPALDPELVGRAGAVLSGLRRRWADAVDE